MVGGLSTWKTGGRQMKKEKRPPTKKLPREREVKPLAKNKGHSTSRREKKT